MNHVHRAAVVGEIERCGVVAVIRLQDAGKLRAVVDSLAEGGVTALEVTMSVPGTIGLIEKIASALPARFVLGAGTILDPETARQAILAGARFIVGPVLNLDVIRLCHRYDVAVMPGCLTPTEILAAWEAGADIVKVFPATALGPSYLKDVRGPLPQVRLMPTGGVTLQNAGDWMRAGAVAVGVGTSLVDREAVERGDFAAIRDRAARFVEAVAAARVRRE
ncbi:MAG: bifunctional 4-hydroxy-2-oxoglutarate aldolase/2-dehydro-3-deoxy-phosphogluconate aldolase [Vicinamibacterales bacterium]